MYFEIRLRSLFLLAGFLVLWGCSRHAGERAPNILLITVDTLRADRLHCYGNEGIETPVIDRLAAMGILFENAYAPIPVTLPSHTSILTGLYPHQHGVRDNGVYLVPGELETLAEILRSNGFETAAFVSAHVLDHIYQVGQGFDVYDDTMEEPLRTDNPIRQGAILPEHTRRWVRRWSEPYQRRAEVTVSRALDWLRRRKPDAPFFCWVHLFDPHLSYTPPDPWAAKYDPGYDGPVDGTSITFDKLARETEGRVEKRHLDQMVALYDGEVSYADAWIGKLLDSIPDSTLIVFTSDHGEAFGEHGQFFEHQRTIFRETVHVPLILTGPGVDGSGVRRGDLVSTVDIVPTVLDYLGLAADGALPGRSLLAADTRDSSAVLYSETMCSRSAVPTPFCYKGVRSGDWSLIYRIAKPDKVNETFLHRLAEDPREETNLYVREPGRYRELRDRFDRLLELGRVDEENPASFWSFGEDDVRRERLRSLGYLR